MTTQDLLTFIYKSLLPMYPDSEAKAIQRILWREHSGGNAIAADKADREAEPSLIANIHSDLQKLLEGIPLQYVLGKCWFYKYEFKVTPDVLIPRPETEELTEWIIDRYRNPKRPLKLIDIGSGSGCIAISIKKELPFIEVEGMDISNEALVVARENAKMLGTAVNFFQQNILHGSPEHNGSYDIIVSNPPYIPSDEAVSMDPNLVKYEPAIALFVPQYNPLIFYDKILSFANRNLKPLGSVYFEIHRDFGQKLIHLLDIKGFTDIELKKDMSGNNRMIRSVKAQI